MELEGLMLGEISQRKTDTVFSHLYVESKNPEFIRAECQMVAASAWGKW